jgi:hypothetical protein
MTKLTKDQVRAALSELYINRSKAAGFKYARSILSRHGNGATSINDLQPEFYGAVYAAVAGSRPMCGGGESHHEADTREPWDLEDELPRHFAAAVVDVREPWDVDDERTEPDPISSARPQTALVRDLEKRLAAARAKTKQSMPSGPVNLGDRSLPGDQADDAGEPQMPSGERLVR